MAQVRVRIHVDVDGDSREFTSTAETNGDGYKTAREVARALFYDVCSWTNDAPALRGVVDQGVGGLG